MTLLNFTPLRIYFESYDKNVSSCLIRSVPDSNEVISFLFQLIMKGFMKS